MSVDIIESAVIDSDDTFFKAKVKFNFIDNQGKEHLAELLVSNCRFDKKRIKKDDFILEQVGIVGDVFFDKESLEKDLGYELVDMIKSRLEAYYKKNLI